jgi:uncharacterized protein YndB with AHSA1/START domain
MTAQTMLEPVRTEVRVAVAPERAFEAFTREFGAWWPRESHHLGEQPLQDAILEPGVGGRWYERTVDGAECDWGRVLVWEPPARLVLAWQIDADWRHDPELVTEVEVRFTADGDGTRVALEHRLLERFGERAADTRAALASEGGWTGLLRRYADQVTS